MSIQWAISIFVGTDIEVPPSTLPERIFFSGVCICSLILASLLVANVVSVVQLSREEYLIYRQQVRGLAYLTQEFKLPISLRSRVRRYMKVTYHAKRKIQLTEESMSVLSDELQQDIMLHVRGRTVVLHPFFKQLSDHLLREICMCLRHNYMGRREVLFAIGEPATSCFFLLSGWFLIMHEDTGTVEQRMMGAPSWVGDKCLFTPDEAGEALRSAAVVCWTDVEYLELPRDQFLEVVRGNHALGQLYQRHLTLLAAGNFTQTGLLCPKCHQYGHDASLCRVELDGSERHSVGSDSGRSWRSSARSSVVPVPEARAAGWTQVLGAGAAAWRSLKDKAEASLANIVRRQPGGEPGTKTPTSANGDNFTPVMTDQVVSKRYKAEAVVPRVAQDDHER